jgi:transposase
MRFVGLDLHKQEIEAAMVDERGAVLHRQRFACQRAAIEAFARSHLSDAHVAVEATFHTWPIVAILEPLVKEVVISNPLRTRAIAQAKIKTDKVDALVLAQLLRADYLPRVWRPDPATQTLRRITTERANLTSDRTRIKNRIHAVLHQHLLTAPCGELFAPAGQAWLKQLELAPHWRANLDRLLEQLALIESHTGQLMQTQAEHAFADDDVKLLMSLPGVDFPVAQTLKAALGDIARFPTPQQAAAYVGLVPSTHQSGNHCYHGKITKQGRGHARWMLVQAAQHVSAHPGPLGVFFRRIAKKKNRNVAVVAAAHKLVVIAWHLLKNREPYRYAQPATTQEKFARLRRRVGKRLPNGSRKGTPRPAHYGSGVRTRAVQGLDQTYQQNGLPPLAELKPGEAAMLQRAGLAGVAASIRKPARVART